MKKTIGIILAVLVVIAVASCSNTLHNAGSIYVSEITAINLPSDGDYALAGAFFENSWDNTNNTKSSTDLSITWEFDPALEVKIGDGEDQFKVVNSGTWNAAVNGGLEDTGNDNPEVFNAEGVSIDSGTYVITYDASKPIEEVLSGEKQ